MDSLDCLPILLSIPVFLLFLFFHFVVVGSVRWIKLIHVSFDCTLNGISYKGKGSPYSITDPGSCES